MQSNNRGRFVGFYNVLLRFLIVEDYMEILYSQFNLHVVNKGFSITESENMSIDEFELLVHMFNERQKELNKTNRSQG
jgi:hypothetical protein